MVTSFFYRFNNVIHRMRRGILVHTNFFSKATIDKTNRLGPSRNKILFTVDR